jgi:hypothetical protein
MFRHAAYDALAGGDVASETDDFFSGPITHKDSNRMSYSPAILPQVALFTKQFGSLVLTEKSLNTKGTMDTIPLATLRDLYIASGTKDAKSLDFGFPS